MSPSRRFRPALVWNAALATSLLAATAAGDSLSVSARPQGVERPVDDAENAMPDVRADGPAASRDTESRRDPAGTSPNSLAPGASPNAALAEAVAPLEADGATRLSVSVLCLNSGASAGYGEARFDTASIVKVDILAALLLLAQDEGRQLTALERARAQVMIEQSDNAAADALWVTIGGAAGLDAANARLGLTATTAGGGGHWGLTQTTSADQIALLRAIYGTGSPLSAASRAYIQELMAGVVPGQRWGISAAADEGFELKNGWLPRSHTGLWDVNSIGRITSGGEEYLVAVVSDGHVTHAAGITAVETAAMAAVEALAAVSTAEDAPPPGV
ncbi:serine hydrolase [Streptomyces litchfieldiae]|uniref:Serine hydrolase n=1 Tax=Streptomyces litchfieldiae TaxID=3075543 RepID=A0ABU2MVI4_9ACTN|nr:serine hydrolase [Streptomyces sp. DSM 44938]MDT0345648.1 serine hydrolase [Streptomyces sp. DSM 44938]